MEIERPFPVRRIRRRDRFANLPIAADRQSRSPAPGSDSFRSASSRRYSNFFNSLKEDTVTGTMHTSIFGGSTANTEFEFLTGNTLAYLPFHSVAYNNHVKVPTPSLTTTLKSRGYGGNSSPSRRKLSGRAGLPA